jgi:hypothetical protein
MQVQAVAAIERETLVMSLCIDRWTRCRSWQRVSASTMHVIRSFADFHTALFFSFQQLVQI